MKKYRVTERHPFYKLGVFFEETEEEIIVRNDSGVLHGGVKEYNLEVQLDRGFIEEIQEPEFTRDNMINFLISEPALRYIDAQSLFNDWLERNKK